MIGDRAADAAFRQISVTVYRMIGSAAIPEVA